MAKREATIAKMCEALRVHLEDLGSDILEKNYVNGDGEIICTVFVVNGPHAQEVTAMFREWATNNGLTRTK